MGEVERESGVEAAGAAAASAKECSSEVAPDAEWGMVGLPTGDP